MLNAPISAVIPSVRCHFEVKSCDSKRIWHSNGSHSTKQTVHFRSFGRHLESFSLCLATRNPCNGDCAHCETFNFTTQMTNEQKFSIWFEMQMVCELRCFFVETENIHFVLIFLFRRQKRFTFRCGVAVDKTIESNRACFLWHTKYVNSMSLQNPPHFERLTTCLVTIEVLAMD